MNTFSSLSINTNNQDMIMNSFVEKNFIYINNIKIQKDIEKDYYYFYPENKENSSILFKKKLIIPKNLFEYLLSYQKEGLCWLWKLHQEGKGTGGILADDMGLGKTIQIVSFTLGLFISKLVSRILLVMPVSAIENWKNELNKWNNKFRVKMFYGSNKSQRNKELEIVIHKGGYCITTYGMISSNYEQLCNNVIWDYVILDEGHKIKNPTRRISKLVRLIPSKHRIILTGTPIQNNLREMWALFDYVHQGSLLGDSKTFKNEFEDVIIRSSDREATEYEKKIAVSVSQQLLDLIKPFFLRREKKEVFQNTSKIFNEQIIEEEKENDINIKKLELKTRKNDFIVWLSISKEQLQLYEAFLNTKEVQNVLNRTNSPLAAISVLKKLCDHPLLLHKEMKTIQELDLTNLPIEQNNTVENLISQSGKMSFLFPLLSELKANCHRTLIFSRSVKMLDIIETVLKSKNYSYLRIDGNLNSKERQKRIDQFNNDFKIFCFLLSTEVGGLGINLTGADRAIIYDPSWTTIDDQAVDRIYRIGQKKNVVIYRLITSGTIEEKIYRKQVFKGSLIKNLFGNQKQHRYFTKQELTELFTLGDIYHSTTQKQLTDLHSHQRIIDENLQSHLKFLNSLGICGISDHDLLFTEQSDIVETDSQSIEKAKEATSKLVLNPSNTFSEPLKNYSSKNNKNQNYKENFNINIKDSICNIHNKENLPKNIPIYHCSCLMNEQQKKTYNYLINLANDFDKKQEWKKAFLSYTEALQLCDEDLTLHQKILELSYKLNKLYF